jgi:hypothetical protein
MALAFVFMMCPAGIAAALIRRYGRAVPGGPAVRGDVPLRLLRWAAGLLSARRAEWGQAMLGELDHIQSRARRWRFAVGCAGGALLLPPWAGPKGIASGAETRANAGRMRFRSVRASGTGRAPPSRRRRSRLRVACSYTRARQGEGPVMLFPHRRWKDPMTAVIIVALFARPPLAAAVTAGGIG